MKRALTALGMTAALLLPAGVTAKPSPTDERQAKNECAALKRASGPKNFANLMRTSKRKASGRCVKSKSREERSERRTAHNGAVIECKAERAQSDAEFAAAHGGKTFSEFYGQRGRGIGQCVSRKRHEAKAAMDAKDRQRVNAARQCRTEQEDEQKFAEEFGTKRNAFGKCVSKRAREKSDSSSS